MEYIFIYLLQLGNVFEGLSILFAIGLIICIIITCIFFIIEKSYDITDSCEQTEKWGKATFIMLCITAVLCLFPTKQTLLLIGGTYYGKKTINTIITDEKLKKVNAIINLELDKRIKELQK